ncbi:MAG: protein-disulfide reductase DsbD [bacterium]|nr:protein-disulfide reductase DsbD [bacterium]
MLKGISMLRFLVLVFLCLGLQAGAAAAVPDFSSIGAGEAEEFLPVAQAFRFSSAEAGGNRLQLEWKVAPGYALYRERIVATLVSPAGVQLAAPVFSTEAVFKNDPSFGRVAVFHDTARAVLELASVPASVAGHAVSIRLSYQGCADAGLCYPPQKVDLVIRHALATKAGSLVVAPLSATPVKEAALALPVAAAAPARLLAGVTEKTALLPAKVRGLEDADGIAGFLRHASLPLILLTFFVLGLGLTFTPCVFPMMPILSGLIAGEDSTTLSTGRAFRLSLAYVLGMASTYALVGTLVGYFGARANVQLWLQTPVVLVGFALVFVLLALSMFGFYELQLPSFLRDRLDALSRQQKGGRLLGVFVMGILSALVVSPCVSAPLAGTLVYISSTGDALLGGLALLALGLGMGTPLVVIGTTGGRFLPRSGNWMLAVKGVFGAGLLAVAIWLVARVVPGPVTLFLWASLLAVSAIYMGALEAAAAGWARLWKGLGVLLLLYAGFLFAGAVTGQDDPLHPLGAFAHTAVSPAATLPEEVQFTRVSTEKGLRAVLDEAARSGHPVVLDFYADWCAACKVMLHTTFRDPAVISVLGLRTRVQLDLSANTDEQRHLLDMFHLYGPPAMLFFNAAGEEEKGLRVQSEISADALRARLSH